MPPDYAILYRHHFQSYHCAQQIAFERLEIDLRPRYLHFQWHSNTVAYPKKLEFLANTANN
ncbi:hypothetical protein OUZ56_019493 [Daphnia magna]|uniref:Uncharacterized protein n=1 Tax=Daphnia magna TaxID=35525 RepID=A0ABQ9ZBQ8_9CRUS|nr:hypothetical protein OUZ56_019493 [Daphnia magna]